MIILAIDLGKFNSMCCFFDTETQKHWFWKAATTRSYLTTVFQNNKRWKNVKRKTDKDDALKLARLAMMGQLKPVHVPTHQGREHRTLVKYRTWGAANRFRGRRFRHSARGSSRSRLDQHRPSAVAFGYLGA